MDIEKKKQCIEELVYAVGKEWKGAKKTNNINLLCMVSGIAEALSWEIQELVGEMEEAPKKRSL